MIPWLKSLLYDPASFANFVRAGVAGTAGLVQLYGIGGKLGWWLGFVGQFAALAIKAGDKNPPAPPLAPPLPSMVQRP